MFVNHSEMMHKEKGNIYQQVAQQAKEARFYKIVAKICAKQHRYFDRQIKFTLRFYKYKQNRCSQETF